MIEVRAFLENHDHVAIGTEAWTVIRAGALVLADRLRRRDINLRFCDNAWAFKGIVTAEQARYAAIPDVQAVSSVVPLFNRHVDPAYRFLPPAKFFALIDYNPGRPNPLRATATGALYCGSIRDLLTTQRLWSDQKIGRPFVSVTVEGDDPWLDLDGAVSHCGTTWVDIEHRRQGVGGMLARLNVMCAWLRFGAWPVFGTIPPDSNLARTFGASRIIGRAMCDDSPTDLILFTQAHLHAEAERIAAHGLQPAEAA